MTGAIRTLWQQRRAACRRNVARLEGTVDRRQRELNRLHNELELARQEGALADDELAPDTDLGETWQG